MSQVTINCIIASLSEILALTAITSIIAYISSRGIEVVATTAFRRIIKRIALGFAKRLIPWLGVALIVIDIILMIVNCTE